MRFTEHELTVAVTAAAKATAGTKRRRANPEEVWESLSKLERYHVLEGVGSQVLPVLAALPDIDVEPGTRPTFSHEQIAVAVEASLGEVKGKVRRMAALLTRAAMIEDALAALPIRQDPDALIVPDSL